MKTNHYTYILYLIASTEIAVTIDQNVDFPQTSTKWFVFNQTV